MPKIRCNCDNIISYSQVPNPNEWLMISDVEYDSYDSGTSLGELYGNMKSILKCDTCGGLWIYWNGFDNEPTFYLPEAVK